MSFTKKTWTDRVAEHIGRRRLTLISQTNAEIVADVARNEGTVTQAGTALNADNFNDLETRIANAFTDVSDEVDSKNADLTDAVFAIRQITLAASSWGVTPVTVNGTEYYTQTVQVTKIYSESPIISIGAAGTLPTSEEQINFAKISAAIADTTMNTLTFYAKSIPNGPVVVIAKEVD